MPLPSLHETVAGFIGKKGRAKSFSEQEVKALLSSLSVPVPRGLLIPRGEEIPHRHGLRFPLAAKISSTLISSKTDIHGVRLNIPDEGALRAACSELMKTEGAEGVLIEEMAPEGVEVIVGGSVDSQFGPIVMFGMGGIFVEIFRDVAFSLAPMSRDDADWLIGQVKGSRLLNGYRGKPPVDRDALIGILLTVSEIMATGLVREIDLNPVALYPKGALVLDAKLQTM